MKNLLLFVLLFAIKANATTYYPTSITQANSLGRAGDSIIFKAGTYTGTLQVKSGVKYKGLGAIISNPNAKGSTTIYLYNVSKAVLEGFTIQDGNQYGVFVDGGGYDTIKNCNINAVGIGVEFGAPYCSLTGSFIHDLKMIVNTPGGYDDYGANGVVVGAKNCTVANNIFQNCKAPSYDFGSDGGAVEVFGDNIDSLTVSNNVAINCEGFAEFGSSTQGHANGVTMSGNILTNNGRVLWVNTSGAFLITTNGLNVSGNVVIETVQGTYTKLSNVPIGKNSYYITTNVKL